MADIFHFGARLTYHSGFVPCTGAWVPSENREWTSTCATRATELLFRLIIKLGGQHFVLVMGLNTDHSDERVRSQTWSSALVSGLVRLEK